MPFSKGSSQPRDQAHVSSVSHLAGRFFIAEPPGNSKEVGDGRPESKGRQVWGHTRDSGFSWE